MSKIIWSHRVWNRIQRRINQPDLKVGFDWAGGASYDTVLGVLAGWSVTVYTTDGRTLEGMVVTEFYDDDCLHLHDWADAEVEWSVTPMDSIRKIIVN